MVPPLRELARLVFHPAVNPFAAQADGAVPELDVFETSGRTRVVDGIDTDRQVQGGLARRHPGPDVWAVRCGKRPHSVSFRAATEVPDRRKSPAACVQHDGQVLTRMLNIYYSRLPAVKSRTEAP